MGRGTSLVLPLILLSGLGQAGGFLNAAEPVKTGEKRDTLLYVRTEPPGARVLINGQEVGTSDGLFHAAPGQGTLLVELEGRQPDKREVIIKANAITRVELSLAPLPGPHPLPEPPGPHYVAHLPQGSVELTGITKSPLTNPSWWKPDGVATNLAPLPPQPMDHWPLLGGRAIFFLIRFKGLPPDASYPAWRVETAGGYGGIQLSDSHGKTIPNAMLFCLEPKKGATKADFRVGIAAGPWHTVVTQQADSLSTADFSFNGEQASVTFHNVGPGPFQKGTQVNLTNTAPHGRWQSRLIAVTTDELAQAQLLGYRGQQGTATFRDLPSESIKELRFQIRPYDWVEFKNVALLPEQKTDVEVISCDEEKVPVTKSGEDSEGSDR